MVWTCEFSCGLLGRFPPPLAECNPQCKSFAPTFQTMAVRHKDVTFVKVDVDKVRE